MIPIGARDENTVIETYELLVSDEDALELEYISRNDWVSMADPCPECHGTEFNHIQYEGGHYGQHEDTVIERTDYWDQKGSLYITCKDCDEVLYKNPAYDVLEAFERGDIPSVDMSDNDYQT